MDITFDQEIYFSNKAHLPLTDIANSLLALEKNAKAAPVALQKIFDDLMVEELQLYVEHLHSGSLSEKIIYRLRVALQSKIEEHTGASLGKLSKVPEKKREQIAAWAATVVILIALKLAADQFKPSADRAHIQNQINILLQEGERLTGVDLPPSAVPVVTGKARG